MLVSPLHTYQGHLAGVSQSEWEAIPDVGDYSLKYKQSKRREIFTPMPDHVIEGARNDTAVSVFFFFFFFFLVCVRPRNRSQHALLFVCT